jgi:hypothetical protein
MKRIAWLVLIFLALPLQAGAEPLTHVRLDVEGAPRVAAELGAEGFDVLEGSVTATSLELVVSARDMEAVVARGFEPITLAVGKPFREIDLERQLQAVPAGYPSLGEILVQLDASAAAHPDIAMVVDLTTTFGVPSTEEGRHLHAIKISDNVAENEDEPAFLMVSDHHAREIVTPVIALDAVEHLTSGYGIDPTITSMVDTYQIWIAPVWNPDGYEYVFNVDNLWRKNRRVFGGDVGVDLNRNFPQGWDAVCSGSTDPSSQTYKGPSPASEAETQTMLAWSDELRFAKVLDYHSAGREVLYAYSCSVHPWEGFLRSEAENLSTESGYGDVRFASAEGEHYQWQLAQNGSDSFLMETAREFQPSYASALTEADRVRPGTIWFLQRPIPLSGHVIDACTGEPLVASITYPDVSFTNGEMNASFEPFGRYHAFLPPGDHIVQFSAPGYTTEARAVSVTDLSAEIVEVELVPSVGCPPIADAGGPYVEECGGVTTSVSLDGTGSSDPDPDDTLAYAWETDCPGTGFDDSTSPKPTLSVNSIGGGVSCSVTLAVTDEAGFSDSDTVTLTVEDTIPPQLACVETTNPSGKNLPKGKNPDGFYELAANDACDPTPVILVSDQAGSGPFGPFASGDKVKITEAPGRTPSAMQMGSSQGKAGAIAVHLTLRSDATMTAIDASGKVATATCLVPPPPQ